MAFPSVDTGIQSIFGRAYATWFLSGGKSGKEPFKELKDLMDLWRRGYAAAETDRIAIGKQWWQQAVDTCLQIGCLSNTLASYGLHIANTKLSNVPQRYIDNQLLPTSVNSYPMTFFFKS